MMRFYMRYVTCDPSGYFMTRWDRATPIEVIADTNGEAFKKVRSVLGDAPRGQDWAMRIDRISEIATSEAEDKS